MQIRELTPDDYEAIATIHNGLHTDRPIVASAVMDSDRRCDPQYKRQRWVALLDGRVVGSGAYSQPVFGYEPHTFRIVINVLPAYQRQGIGTALYQQLMTALQPFEPARLYANAYENLPGGIPFLTKHGFVEVFRERKSVLDVTAFDPTPYAALLARLEAANIELVTLAELGEDPECQRALYELERDAMLDIPGVTESGLNWPDFDTWKNDLYGDPNFRPEMYFVARHQAEYVGMSMMSPDPASDAAYQWLTGVKRHYRRQGIGLALKLKGITYAKTHGYNTLRTSTSVDNQPILALSSRLGFKPLSEWVDMEKVLRDED
jgi:GNAT superfamily N-acetyltransferase